MLSYVKFTKNSQGKDFKRYYCLQCGAFLATSLDQSPQKGTIRHSYVNPAGIRCDFLTFSRCDNVIAHQERYKEHSWFEGYTWRFLLCARCLGHLGWQYDPLETTGKQESFFGLLLNAVSFVSVN
ncbi:MAG: cereblon family protein [Desulfomonilaceae bacterium]